MTVQISFQPPRRRDRPEGSSPHKRRLDDVPKSTAEKIHRDFRAYESNPTESEQYKLYEFKTADEMAQSEVSVALDFGEVVELRLLR